MEKKHLCFMSLILSAHDSVDVLHVYLYIRTITKRLASLTFMFTIRFAGFSKL